MTFKLLVSMLAVLTLCSCESDKDYSQLTIAELNSVSTETDVGENTIILAPYLWRNFQPGGEESNSNLRASVTLADVNYREITTLSTSYIYVINNDEIWFTKLTEQPQSTEQAYEIDFGAVDGPKWDTGIYVDVVVAFNLNGEYTHVKTTEQYINETY
ncbi:hypothetical protein [uncultured Paraglaciecola sp.]|uniref:hypothetical protein n=1 Tax=uncultured Paraglaciecola sp. TaxID=1765024 RepID=UPI002597BAC6|nr:hypothetical protein [uncultured Paraglaciecola sp.]